MLNHEAQEQTIERRPARPIELPQLLAESIPGITCVESMPVIIM